MLQHRQTDLLAYLEESWARADEARDKPWNASPQAKAFIEYSLEVYLPDSDSQELHSIDIAGAGDIPGAIGDRSQRHPRHPKYPNLT